MSIAVSVRDYLQKQGIRYDLVAHPHSQDSMHSASAAHVPGDRLAKGVVLEDEMGYLMAIVPSTRRVDLGVLHHQLNRRLGLATEQELGVLFRDCEFGAVPPLGDAYGIDAMIDETLTQCEDIYFEGGDHAELVHVSGEDFMRLQAGVRRGRFSHHP
jgi:Ala-tRNA(Pro) deacylase